jgi:hypothetical protein
MFKQEGAEKALGSGKSLKPKAKSQECGMGSGKWGMRMLVMVMMLMMIGTAIGQTVEGVTDDPRDIFSYDLGEYWWGFMQDYIADQDSGYQTFSPQVIGQDPLEWPAIYMPVLNKEADTLVAGDVVVWDTTRIAVADTLKAKPGRIENSLTAEGGYYWLYVVADGTASNDSLWLYGKDEAGAAQTEIVVITGGATTYTRSAYMWTDVDSAEDNQAAQGWDSWDLCALPWMGVRASDGTSLDIAGVVVGSGWTRDGLSSTEILDNTIGFICVQGVCQAYIDGGTTDAWPGDMLRPTSGGDLIRATDSTYVAYQWIQCLELITADNTKGRVWIK